MYCPARSGKTYLYDCLLAYVQANNRIALAVASSGIASLLLHDGCTTHSHFKVTIPINENTTCNIKKCTDLAKLLQETILVVWDEAP
ncbi:13608_t:CDS:1, partial [Entrophospora sp. SA101]